MPIQGKVSANNGNYEKFLGTVVPGKHVALASYPETGEELISVVCYRDDRGGEVYRFSADFDEDWLINGIPAKMLSEENLEACIWPNEEPFRMDIVNRTGTQAQLVLEHVVTVEQVSP